MQNHEHDPYHYPIKLDGKLTKDERRVLESKLKKLLSWVGERIPETITVDNTKLPLHEVIWRLIKKDRLTDEELALVYRLERLLEDRLNEDLKKIEFKDVTENQAIKDYIEALGLIRAIITLKDITSKEDRFHDERKVARKISDRRITDTASWLNYLKNVL